MIKKGYAGKVTDIADSVPFRDRTNIDKFLSKSTFDENLVESLLRNLVVKKYGIFLSQQVNQFMFY